MPRLSPLQKATRRLGIGSSDVAELLGISPYDGASPVRLFAEKTGLLGDEEEDEETTEKEVGHALEGALVRLYEKKSGYQALVAGEFVESVAHREHPWRRANLDARIVGKRAALEVKAVGIGMFGDWDLLVDDGIPHYVRVQVAWQMHVADLDEVHVVALVAGPSGFRVFYVLRDLELESMIVEAACNMWEMIQANKVPPLDGSAATRAYLNRMYPQPPEDVEIAVEDDATIEIGNRRLMAESARAIAADAKEILTGQLIEAMGKAGATVMWCDTWKASYRADKHGSRSLRIKARGAPRVRSPMANVENPPMLLTPDGEVF